MKKYVTACLTFVISFFLTYTAKATTNQYKDWLQELNSLKKQDIYFDQQHPADSVLAHIAQLNPILKERKDYYHYFDTWRFKINVLATQGDWITAINEATSLHNEAKALNNAIGMAISCYAIGDAYSYIHMFNKSLELYEGALRILDQKEENNELQHSLLLQMIYATIFCKNTDKAHAYIQRLENLQLDADKQYPATIHKDLCLAIYYTATHNKEKAQYWIYQAKKENYASYKYNNYLRIQSATGYYYETFGHYSQAIAAYSNALSGNSLSTYYSFVPLVNRARLYEKLQDSLHAFYDYQRMFLLKDSTYRQSYTRQMSMLRADNQINQMELDNELNKNQIISTLILVIVVALIVSSLAIFHIRRDSLKLNEANQKRTMAIQNMERSIHSKNLYLTDVSQIVKESLLELDKDCSTLKQGKETNTNKSILSNKILHNSTLLLKQINELLNASNVNCNYQKLVFEVEEAASICKEAIQITEKNVNNCHINFQQTEENEHLFILTDRMQLIQVLVCLMSMVRRNTIGKEVSLSLQKQDNGQVLMTLNGTDCQLQERNILDITLTNSLMIIQKLNGSLWIGENSYKKMRLYIQMPSIYNSPEA